LVVEAPKSTDADFLYRIFNADGSEVNQCGNGARCFARFVQEKRLSSKNPIVVDTHCGQLHLQTDANNNVTVNMGIPRHKPEEIPMQAEAESAVYTLFFEGIETRFGSVSVGNPHAVLLTESIDNAPLTTLGRAIEHSPLFPERVNVGFMQIIDEHHIRLRVYERGVGETLACGSGACAAAIIGIEQNALKDPVRVDLHGGELMISWHGRGTPVFLTGSAENIFEGTIQI
jgi:diaminopimelate epimerase